MKFDRAILQRVPRHLQVVKRHGVIGKFLIRFVSFPRDQNDVARLGQSDRARDCFFPIRNRLIMG
jgi:hypothetical protein